MQVINHHKKETGSRALKEGDTLRVLRSQHLYLGDLPGGSDKTTS